MSTEYVPNISVELELYLLAGASQYVTASPAAVAFAR